jgi:tRNA(Ile)-lysidine synthase
VTNALAPSKDIIDRFRTDLDVLSSPGDRLGVAVSGGPDSLALLLLAAAARPGQVGAATVDHQLRAGSGKEARFVASVCKRLGVPHVTLRTEIPPGASVQAQARTARYQAIGNWAIELNLKAVATAHHADDQAETLLMRLARGAGLSGLSATRRRRVLEPGIMLVRPLLGWRRQELRAIVDDAGLTPVDDPANRDPRHDRTRFRGLLDEAEWADAERLALSAHWLADADEALEWALAALAKDLIAETADSATIEAAGLPREFQRRLLLLAFDRLTGHRPRGPELDRAMRLLIDGKSTTLGGLKLAGGSKWRLSVAPKRRS